VVERPALWRDGGSFYTNAWLGLPAGTPCGLDRYMSEWNSFIAA